jgi:hypothetical protein
MLAFLEISVIYLLLNKSLLSASPVQPVFEVPLIMGTNMENLILV